MGTKQQHVSRNFDNESYKLFEANDVAKYGICKENQPIEAIKLKLLLYLLWKCNAETPGEFEMLCISVKELADALGYEKDENRHFARTSKWIYKELESLMSVALQIYDSSKGQIDTYNVISHVGMNVNTGMILVEFGPHLETLFGTGLRKDFTVVKLMYLNRLNNRSSVYLYPFFCRYKNLGFFSYDIKALKSLLTGDEACEYKYLKRRHLIPALKEINKMTDISVEMKENKRGKTVTSLSFHVTEDPAEDEWLLFALANQLGLDECTVTPYDDAWKNGYDYDMGSQEYVQKVEGRECFR